MNNQEQIAATIETIQESVNSFGATRGLHERLSDLTDKQILEIWGADTLSDLKAYVGAWLRCAASEAPATPPITTGRKLYTMNTTKTENGFSFTVREFTETTQPQSNGQYGLWATVDHVDGHSSRARATSAGRKSKVSRKRAA